MGVSFSRALNYQPHQNPPGLDTNGLDLEDQLNENHPGVEGHTSPSDFGHHANQNHSLLLSAFKKAAAFVRHPSTWTAGLGCLITGLYAGGNTVALRSSAVMLNGSQKFLDENNFNTTVVPGITDPAAKLKALVTNDEKMRQQFKDNVGAFGEISEQVRKVNQTYLGEVPRSVTNGTGRLTIDNLGVRGTSYLFAKTLADQAAMNGANYLLRQVAHLIPAGVIFKNASVDITTAGNLLGFSTDGPSGDEGWNKYPNCVGTSTFSNFFSDVPNAIYPSTDVVLADLRKVPGLQNLTVFSVEDTEPYFESTRENPAEQVFITGAQALANLNGTQASALREIVTCLTDNSTLVTPYSGTEELSNHLEVLLGKMFNALKTQHELPAANISSPPLTLTSLHEALQAFTGQKITLDDMLADVNAAVSALCLAVGSLLTVSAMAARLIQGPQEKPTPEQAQRRLVEMAAIIIPEARGSSSSESVGSVNQAPPVVPSVPFTRVY